MTINIDLPSLEELSKFPSDLTINIKVANSNGNFELDGLVEVVEREVETKQEPIDEIDSDMTELSDI